LDLFDSRKGTYYGDPNPPEIDCPWDEYNCEDEEPEEELYPYGLSEGPVQDTRPLWAKVSKVPFPHPTGSGEIVADFIAGLRRLRLDRVAALKPLMMTDGTRQLSSIESIASWDGGEGYYLLNFVGTGSTKIVAQATITSTGLLSAVRLVPEGETERLIGQLSQARLVLSREYRLNAQVQGGRVFVPGLKATPFAPFFVAKTNNGEQILLAADGAAFAIASGASPQNLLRRPEASHQRLVPLARRH